MNQKTLAKPRVRRVKMFVMEVTAYHEAGHAFMAVYLGARVRSVTIDPDRDDGPRRQGDTAVEWNLAGLTEREIDERSVIVALAGPAAEMLYTGEPFHPGFVRECSGDWKAATDAASKFLHKEEKRIAWLEEKTKGLLRMLNGPAHWAAIAELADNLLAHETLHADQIEDVVRTWLPSTPD